MPSTSKNKGIRVLQTMTIKELKQKIAELNEKLTELESSSNIDIVNSSPEKIIENAVKDQQSRNSAAHLRSVIADLKTQLDYEVNKDKTTQLELQTARGFNSLEAQSDRVIGAAAQLADELSKLRVIGKAIASNHMQATGKLALDDRLSPDFRLPVVEKLNNSIIIHNQARNYL